RTVTESAASAVPSKAVTATAPNVLAVFLIMWSKLARFDQSFKMGCVKKGEETRGRIVEAALEALRTKGFAGASTRAIAEIGGHNPALTFYFFGSLPRLLLSALGEASPGRREAAPSCSR